MATIVSEQSRAKEIRSRMEQIRASLPVSISEAKTEVRNLSDWKFYLKSYPLFILPAVVTLAYYAVPYKQSITPIAAAQLRGSSHRNDVHQGPVAKKSFLAGVGSVAAGLAFRALSSYATQKLSAKISELGDVRNHENSSWQSE